MKKIELLAPAGNYEKACLALHYGADAVFIGGHHLSLRFRASNFTNEDIKNIVLFAHERGKRVYVTTNIIPHDEDLADVDDYLRFLAEVKVDAIIVSSPYIIEQAKKHAPQLECHLSTQMSVFNQKSLVYWEKKGIKRIVLAREVMLDELKAIAQAAAIELEVFIHGGMCASFSGRCVLSNHMTSRDANRGGCAHSCRWNYALYQNNELMKGTFNFGSKDLMAVSFIQDLIEMGIASLKIEGRMKSSYYLACIVGAYRRLIDAYYAKNYLNDEDLNQAIDEISKAENRPTSTGFYQGLPGVNATLYDDRNNHPTKEYLGMVLADQNGYTIIEQRNYFAKGDLVEFFGPEGIKGRHEVGDFYDFETNELLEIARHPLQKIKMKLTFPLASLDMMRLVR